MPAQIRKSLIRGIKDFDAVVANHAAEKTAWRAHMTLVGKDPKKYQSYPEPQAHVEIEKAITEKEMPDGTITYEPDFTVIDDGPTPEQMLRQRKDNMMLAVSQLEQMAVQSVVPSGSKRHFHLREHDIRVKENARGRDLRISASGERLAALLKIRADFNDGIQQDLKKKNSGEAMLARIQTHDEPALLNVAHPEMTDEHVAAVLTKERSPDDQTFLYQQQERRDLEEAITRHAAKLLHDIEGLTADNIDAWQPEPFPKREAT